MKLSVIIGFEQLAQVSSFKKVDLQESKDARDGQSQFGHEFHEGQNQIDAHGDPDLGEDGVARRAHEAHNLQILLVAFKLNLDLPTLPVDIGDGFDGELVMVGQEDMIPVENRGMISDPPQMTRTFFGFWSGKGDGLIGGHALARTDLPPGYDSISCVGLQAVDTISFFSVLMKRSVSALALGLL